MQLSRDAIQRMIGGRTNVQGTGGGGSEFDPSGFVTLEYLKSLTWWGQSLNDNDAVVGALTGVTDITMTGALAGATNVSAQKVTIGGFEIVYDSTNQALKFNGSIYATGGVSALGYGPGGGGGGVSALTDLVDVAISSPTNGQVLMYNSSTGKWYNGNVQSGGGGTVTSITAGTGLTGGTITTSGTIALSEDTRTAIAAGVTAYGWGDHAQAGYLTSSDISDMATKTWVGQQGFLTSSALTGYATQQWVNNQGFLTSSALTGYATQQWVNNQGFLTSVSFSDLTTHPTTIAGYGITDAKIQNGTITLGSNSITPLTSHQTVSGTFWGQAWSNGGTVKGSLAAGSNGGVIEQFHCIELNNAGSLSSYGGYIDFHYNGSAADYTTRLIESEAGVLLIQGKNSASPYGDKVVGLKIGSNVTGGSYVQIGNVQLVFDATNNALKVQKSDGTAANLYATGGVSALGMSAGVSTVDAMTFNNLRVNNSIKFNSSVNVITGELSQIVRTFNDSDCIYLLNFSDSSKETSSNYYYNQYDNIGLHGTNYNYDETWFIDPDGCARFKRLYLDSTRYLYINGGTLYYFNGSTSRQIAFA